VKTCDKHTFELAEGMCRRCGIWFCTSCLVYAFGAKKPPYCVACAIHAAGVRSTSGYAPRVSRGQLRRELRAHRQEMKAAEAASPAEPVSRFDAEVSAWQQGDEIWEDTLQR
jgi:hypothetical protein